MSLSSPHARVEIDGQLFDSWLQPSLFSSVSVKLKTNESSEANLTVIDGDYRFLDSYSRADGVPVVEANVWLGYGDDLGAPLFGGLLAAAEHGGDQTTLCFYDHSFNMRREQRTEYHKGLDIDVIGKLARRSGLDFEGPGKEARGLPLKSKKQEAQTDWEMAMRLAEEAGLVLYVRGKTLFAKPPARTAAPVLSFGARDALLLRGGDGRYKVPENQEGRPGQVEHRGRGRGGKRLSGVSDTNRGTKQLIINRSLKGLSQSEANRRAQAQKELKREPAFNCRIHSLLQADPRVDVRQTIELTERGLLFSGLYLVDSVDHSFSAGKLDTDYDLYRDVKDGSRA
jgi:phage protein D